MDKLINGDGTEIKLKYPVKIEATTEKGLKPYRLDKYSNGGICMTVEQKKLLTNPVKKIP
jgi:hypothetical protein